MPRPQYRGRAAAAEVGDYVAGWRDAEMTDEVEGHVVDLLPEQAAGDNVTLAVIEYDPYPEGVEPPADGPESPDGRRGPGKGVAIKGHDNRSAVLNLRLITCNSERLELIRRRTGLQGRRGGLRTPHEDVLRARHGEEELRRRQLGQTGPLTQGQAGEPQRTPIVSRAPEPLPAAQTHGKDETKPAQLQHAPARDEGKAGGKR